MTGYNNFQSLVIAGLGSIGGSMFALGGQHIQAFDRVIAVDREPGKRLSPRVDGVELLTGDITDCAFLNELLLMLPGPVLFVNLCAGVDNVRLRRRLAGLPVAYLDSCCCTPENTDEYRFSRMMPYTLTPVESEYPHWVCWGINPGGVELMARLLLERMRLPAAQASITIFEHDGLFEYNDRKRPAVGWCPSFLVEEMLISPALIVERNDFLEGSRPGGLPALARWSGVAVPSRVVGHEDIWNLGRLLGAGNACFVYGLSPAVMRLLESQDAVSAAAALQVPTPITALGGLERIAVQVRSLADGALQTLLWETDHGQVWKQFGVNAVQYQTCLSLWFAVHLLHNTRYGNLPGTWCASNLPITQKDWKEIEQAMASMGIAWEEADHLDLRLEMTNLGKT